MVGVEELTELEISIFPNPTTEFVNIVTPHSIKLSIYDMTGRLVATHHLTDESTQLDVNGMSRGTYNMIFESKDHKTKSAKLIVQ